MNYYVMQLPPNRSISGAVSFTPALSGYYRYLTTPSSVKIDSVSLILAPNVRKLRSDFLTGGGQGHFVSKKVATTLGNLHNELILIPAKVEYHDGTHVPDEYYLLHVLNNRVDAVDLENSDYKEKKKVLSGTHDPTRPLTNFKRLRLLPDALGGLHIFYLSRVGFYFPLVSEDIAKPLMKGKLTDLDLVPVSEYQDPS